MIFSIIVRKKYLYRAFKIIFSPETFSTSLRHTGDNLERRFRRHLGGRGLMAFLCFTVMSDFSLDEPGFKAPGALTPVPPSLDSSVEAPPEVCRKCVACPRRMSKKTADRRTLCVSCRGFDCDIDTCCEECLEWPKEEVRLYAKYRKSLKSKDSSKSKPSPPPPPPADSVPSSQSSMRGDIQSQVDSLNVTVTTLAESLSARLDALTASLISSQSTQLSSQPRLGPDVGEPQPGETAGTRRTFQALGVPHGTSVVPPNVSHPFGQGYRALASEQLGSASVGSGCRSAHLRLSGSPSAASAFWGSASSTFHLWLGSFWPSSHSYTS